MVGDEQKTSKLVIKPGAKSAKNEKGGDGIAMLAKALKHVAFKYFPNCRRNGEAIKPYLLFDKY